MRRAMRSWWLRAAVLVWVASFFVVFIPAHRRGIVQLPGDSGRSITAAGKPYCPLCTILPPSPAVADAGFVSIIDAGEDASRPPADAPVNCAVCFLKARLDTPAALTLPPTFIDELVFTLRLLHVIEAEQLASTVTLHGPAPPLG